MTTTELHDTNRSMLEEVTVRAALNPWHPDTLAVIGHVPEDQWAHAVLIAEMAATDPHPEKSVHTEKYFEWERDFSLPARVMRLAAIQGDTTIFEEYAKKYATNLEPIELEHVWGLWNYFGAQPEHFETGREILLKIR